MTDGIMQVVEDWTGYKPLSCPWRAYSDPFVIEVLMAYPHWDKSQLTTYAPEASRRLVEGITYYDHILNVCREKRRELEDKARGHKKS